MDWIPHIYIMCNREKEPKRYAFLQQHLPSRGIPIDKVHWVTSLWGSDLTSELVQKVYFPFKTRFGINMNLSFQSAALTRGELSLMLTFREAIRQILEAKHEYAIIFESDIFLRKDFLERLKIILETKNSWDYISLSEGVGTRPPGSHPSYFSEQALYTPPHEWVFRCCDSNLLRRTFLEKVWQTFIPFQECLDWEMNIQLAIHQGKALWADPPISEPGSGRSRFATSLPT